MPAFPDDIISFIAGLTAIRIRDLILISLLGRLPGYIVLNFTGNGITYENLNPVVVTFVALFIAFIITFWKRKWIHEFVYHKNRIIFLKEQWNTSWKSIILWTIVIIAISILLYRLATVVPIQR